MIQRVRRQEGREAERSKKYRNYCCYYYYYYNYCYYCWKRIYLLLRDACSEKMHGVYYRSILRPGGGIKHL